MTTKVGLLGWPVAHSVSPAMHNAAFQALGLDWEYTLLPIAPPDLIRDFGLLLEAGYVGFNVTIPYKRDLLATIGRIQPDEAVMAIGAANTIFMTDDGALHAANTDWRGLMTDLDAHDIMVGSAHCLILGTGGSAKAAAYTLRQLNTASITFASRTPSGDPDTVSYDLLPEILPDVTLVINCTPLGMWPAVDSSPWPRHIPFPAHSCLYDLVYNPAETTLMKTAAAAGARAVGGLGMLVRQGAFSFEMWTGQTPPLDEMEDAAQEALLNLSR